MPRELRRGEVLTCAVCAMDHTVTAAQAKPVRKGQVLLMLCDGPGRSELIKHDPRDEAIAMLNRNGRHAPTPLNA